MSSIQDFLMANLFRLDEKNGAFVRGADRIYFDDLVGKSLAYFQERYGLNGLDPDQIEAETLDPFSPYEAHDLFASHPDQIERETPDTYISADGLYLYTDGTPPINH
jgi:hypothetical protein